MEDKWCFCTKKRCLIQSLHTCVSSITRYSDRVLISHKKTRTCLSLFACKGCEVEELLGLIDKHAPFLKDLVQHLVTIGMNGTQSKCPKEWEEFVDALASSSPVCAIVHPSDRLLQTILDLESRQYANSMTTLQYLQHEVPVLFELLRTLKTFPKFFSPVLKEMVRKAQSPFQTSDSSTSISPSDGPEDMSFFPNLTRIRSRGIYVADKDAKTKICTKRRIGHPTLLPGLFTMYCKHGKHMHVQVVSVHHLICTFIWANVRSYACTVHV